MTAEDYNAAHLLGHHPYARARCHPTAVEHVAGLCHDLDVDIDCVEDADHAPEFVAFWNERGQPTGWWNIVTGQLNIMEGVLH